MKVGLFIFPVRFSEIPPIDIAYLSAYLKKAGHQVYIRDFNSELSVDNSNDSGFWIGKDNQKELFEKNTSRVSGWVKDILDFSADVVGFSVYYEQIFFALEIAKMIKAKNENTRIVFGGSICAFLRRGRELITYKQVDYVVAGEGEATLREIVESKDYTKPIKGCLSKHNGEILDGGYREEINNIDDLPFPDYTELKFSNYIRPTTYPISFTRGCTWRCSFCTAPLVWKKFRARSAGNVFSEIKHCLSSYPFIKDFYVCDHSMNAQIPLISELSELIIKNNINIDGFIGYGQVNSRMTDKTLLKKLKRAGFSCWGIGIQSGSDHVLKSMKRLHTAEEAEKLLKAMSSIGMNVSIDFIIGYPEERDVDFLKTLNFITRVKKYLTDISVTSCGIGNNDIQFNPSKYGIIAINDFDNAWASIHSTPAIRAERHKIFVEHLNNSGFKSVKPGANHFILENSRH
ncbi:MAG: radical SAM protein [Candidatus Omnitrophota bacterium]